MRGDGAVAILISMLAPVWIMRRALNGFPEPAPRARRWQIDGSCLYSLLRSRADSGRLVDALESRSLAAAGAGYRRFNRGATAGRRPVLVRLRPDRLAVRLAA